MTNDQLRKEFEENTPGLEACDGCESCEEFRNKILDWFLQKRKEEIEEMKSKINNMWKFYLDNNEEHTFFLLLNEVLSVLKDYE